MGKGKGEGKEKKSKRKEKEKGEGKGKEKSLRKVGRTDGRTHEHTGDFILSMHCIGQTKSKVL